MKRKIPKKFISRIGCTLALLAAVAMFTHTGHVDLNSSLHSNHPCALCHIQSLDSVSIFVPQSPEFVYSSLTALIKQVVIIEKVFFTDSPRAPPFA